MAVDVGTVRIGLAKSDPSGRIALPIATIAAKPRETALQTILTYARELRPSQVIDGLPLTLDGDEAYARLKALAQMNPPIRNRPHIDGLWRGIQQGVVDGPLAYFALHGILVIAAFAMGAGREPTGTAAKDPRT